MQRHVWARPFLDANDTALESRRQPESKDRLKAALQPWRLVPGNGRAHVWMAWACGLMILGEVCTASAAEATAAWRAGVARREITPREPVPMWGYGARRAALSEGALDPLLATALVLETDGRKLALVSLDLGRPPSEESLAAIRTRIREGAGIDDAFIAGSHTHHGPVVELADRPGRGKGAFDAALRYNAYLADQIVAAVLEADRTRRPVRLAVGTEQLQGFNRNRHSKLQSPPVDRDLAILRVDDLAGTTVAVLVNFAAHPTLVESTELRFSADYIGAVRKTVEEELGGLMLFMQGAMGDLSPALEGRAGYLEYGQALGREVVRMAKAIPAREHAATLAFREERLCFRPRIDLGNPLTRTALGLAFFPELVANYVDEYAEGVRPRLSVALLEGDIVMVGMSAEVFCAHAIRFKDRARVPHLFFFGTCNGYHQYLPTIESVAEGGYGTEAAVAPAELGAGERMADTALLWLQAMLGKPPKSALQSLIGLE